MKKKTITKFQYFTTFFFLLQMWIPFVGFHSLTRIANQDALFGILLGTLEIFLFSLCIQNIDTYHPNKTLYQKIKDLYPKFSYVLFPFLFSLLLFLLLWITQKMSLFLHSYLTPEIDAFWTMIPLFLILFYFLQKPKEAIFQTTELCFYLYLFLFLLFLFGILPQSNFLRIKPLLSESPSSILQSSFVFFLSYPLSFFLLLYFPKNWLEKKEEQEKTKKKALFLSGLTLFLYLFLILSSLGIYLTNLYKNPLMITYQKISFLNILERVETTLSFSYVLLYFFPLVFLFYHLTSFLKEQFPQIQKKEKTILFLLLLFVLLGSQFFTFSSLFYSSSNILILFFLLFLSLSIRFKKN